MLPPPVADAFDAKTAVEVSAEIKVPRDTLGARGFKTTSVAPTGNGSDQNAHVGCAHTDNGERAAHAEEHAAADGEIG